MALPSFAIRAAVGAGVVPALDIFTGRGPPGSVKDAIPFGHIFDDDYGLADFKIDSLRFLTSSVVTAAPYSGALANIVASGEHGFPFSRTPKTPPGALAALAVGGYLLHDVFPIITEVVNPSNPFSAV